MLIRAFLWGNDLKAFLLLKSAIFAFPHECHKKPTTATTTWNSKQKLKSAIFCFFSHSFFQKTSVDTPFIPVTRNFFWTKKYHSLILESPSAPNHLTSCTLPQWYFSFLFTKKCHRSIIEVSFACIKLLSTILHTIHRQSIEPSPWLYVTKRIPRMA